MIRRKKLISGVFLILFVQPVFALEPVFSGIVESNATCRNGKFSGTTWTAEQYANLRMQISVNEKAKVYAAVNASAVSAEEQEMNTQAELERLYAAIRGDVFDLDAGYMRIPFGYGQAFKPSDFINPLNPVYPEARPKGALGFTLSSYPIDEIKLQLFGADRTNPYVQYPGYSRPLGGLMGELHNSLFSLQSLYAVQKSEERNSRKLVSYGGLSLKFDAIAGFALDSLCTYKGESPSINDLQAAFGVDYSFFDNDLYVLVQYYFNGHGYLDPNDNIDDLYQTDKWPELKPEERIPVSGFSDYYRKHYVFFSAMYSFNDFTRMTASVLCAAEDMSFLPALQAEHEPFQGMTVSLTVRVPVDRHLLNGEEYGELGPAFTDISEFILGSIKLKF